MIANRFLVSSNENVRLGQIFLLVVYLNVRLKAGSVENNA